MLMVVFGAGASCDSIDPDYTTLTHQQGLYRPPLANGLFQDNALYGPVINALPYLQGIVPDLRAFSRQTDASIEDKLIEFERDADAGSLQRKRQLAAMRYYLDSILRDCSEKWPTFASGVTNYARLLDRLIVWQEQVGEAVTFVTFNYDTLLEQALARVGYPLATLDSFVARRELRVIKAHGSVDWYHLTSVSNRLMTSQVFNTYIEHVDAIGVDEGFLHGQPQERTMHNGQTWVPALAIPLTRDKRFECPDGHIKVLRDAARATTRLLVIGWAGVDAHFLELLKVEGCQPSKGLVVCGSEAASAATNARIHREAGIGTCRPLPSGFSSLFNDDGASGMQWLLA